MRLIVPFTAGGGTDVRARLIGQWLSERLGQQFVIENRPGAGGNIATEVVVKAPPDGYALLLVGTSSAINATLYEKLSFNFVRDVAPVASISRNSFIMVVHPSVPAKTVPELIAYANANPGKVSMASAGNGSLAHLAGEQFKMMTGVNMVHVPYRGGGPAMTDLIGGQVQIAFEDISSSIEHVRAGRLRALAVTTARRPEALPDIPSVGEFVPAYEASGWSGIGAPKNTSPEVIDKLNKEINAALADPKIRARAARGPGGHGAGALARRLWKAHRRRNRKVGQSDPGGQHQGVITHGWIFQNVRCANVASPMTGSGQNRQNSQ